MPPKSLITSLRERYLTSIRSVQPPSRWKILVVDSFTKELLSSVMKMFDILQENVSQVESIEQARASQPTTEAAYLLCPTSQNVERIIRDLAPEGGRQPQYAAGHVFFVDGLSDKLLQRLTSSPAEPKLRQLIELFTNFWPLESQVFSLKTPKSFFTLYQTPGGLYGPDHMESMQAIEDELQFTTQTLLNVCVTLNEFPLIRYYNPSHPPLGPLAPPPNAVESRTAAANLYQGSARMARLRGNANEGALPGAGGSGPGVGEHFTRKLALRLQSAIDDYVRDNEPKGDPGRPKGVLFITDRSMDTVAPFLHEFSYQAMCNDLLPVEDGSKFHYKFISSDGQREERDAILSDEDTVWTAIRHVHIAEAIDKLSRDFKQHAGEAGAFADQNSSLNDMRDMLASLPHMQDMKEKLSLHLTMAQECMNRFEKSRLPDQAMVEQNCATRLTPEGQKPRTLVEEMVPLLDDRGVSNVDKVRIIALYIMYCEGVPDEDRKRLFQHARLSLHEMDAVNNLVNLGARVVKDSASSGWDAWFKKGKRKQQPGDNEYELSRYQPLVKLMIEDHFAGKLDQATYPYVKDAPPEIASSSLMSSAMSAAGGRDSPLARVGMGGSSSAAPKAPPSSLRSAKPTWHQKGRMGAGVNAEKHENRQRVIVFVAGGMTYSEVRSAYQCSDKLGRDCYIGSSHTFTPESFIESLKRFNKASNTSEPHAGHHHSHHHHHDSHASLPSGASVLSKPENQVSGIRNASMLRSGHDAARARDPGYSNGGGSGYAYSQQSGPNHGHQHSSSVPIVQSTYDKRFQTSGPEAVQSPKGGNGYGQYPQPQPQTQLGSRAQTLPTQGGLNAPGLNQGNGNGRASPSSGSFSDLSAKGQKEKKRMKNPFSFKKS
ncbi:Sec1-like protein [Violaceomyces palustris]|uniref:Sec1-like protein n=1 Tax=Violaceomyces palustris TaxID=1673888 RepID=A0ACD0P0X0_9BASI|nr:Sec1-like protein [Violaceomyces palustris]